MSKHYSGIGARSTPQDILSIMTSIARKLNSRGYILRSGGAIGADRAFEAGSTAKQIYYANDATPQSIELASQFHPAWNKCNDYVKKLHGRNALILLGGNLDTPAEFVICWTPDGKDSGGTGLGIRIAKHYGIRVNNLQNPEVLQKTKEWLR